MVLPLQTFSSPSSSHLNPNRKYLCAAPRPETWEDHADSILKNLGSTLKEQRQALKGTLRRINQIHPFQPRTGPGRKSNAEHAIRFYEFLLERIKTNSDDDDIEDEAEEIGGEGTNTKEQDRQEEAEREPKQLPAERKQEPAAATPTSTTTETVASTQQRVGGGEESSMDAVQFSVQHNDLCEVCEEAGELLMCGTCNLVFHLECVRPVMKKPPSQKLWRCAYCVLAHEPKNSRPRKRAAAAVRLMARSRNQNRRKKALAAASSSSNSSTSGANNNMPRSEEDDVANAADDEAEAEDKEDITKSEPNTVRCSLEERESVVKIPSQKADSKTSPEEAPKRSPDEPPEEVDPKIQEERNVPDKPETLIEDKKTDSVKDGSTESAESLEMTAGVKSEMGQGGKAHDDATMSDKKEEVFSEERAKQGRNGKSEAGKFEDEGNYRETEGGETEAVEGDSNTEKLEKADVRDAKAGEEGKSMADMRKPEKKDTPEVRKEGEGIGGGGNMSSRKRNLELFKIADSFSPILRMDSTDEAGRGKRSRKQPTLYDPQLGPAGKWQSDEVPPRSDKSGASEGEGEESATNNDTGTNNSSGKANEPATIVTKEAGAVDEEDKISRKAMRVGGGGQATWCGFCKDDLAVRVCFFCACRVCFGKHHQNMLLLCDSCDEEYHTFCLDPPLDAVPSRKWFCPSCVAMHEKQINIKSGPRLGTRGVATASTITASSNSSSKAAPVSSSSSPKRSSNRKSTPTPKKESADSVTEQKRFSALAHSSSSSSSRSRSDRVDKGGKSKKSPTPGGKKRSRALPIASSLPSPSRKRSKSSSSSRVSIIATHAASTDTPKKSPRSKGSGLAISSNAPLAVALPAIKEETMAIPEAVTPRSTVSESVSASASAAATSSIVPAPRIVPLSIRSDTFSLPVKVSRSGRPVKRSTFHDEIDEGEQHLRSGRYAGMQRKAAAAAAATLTAEEPEKLPKKASFEKRESTTKRKPAPTPAQEPAPTVLSATASLVPDEPAVSSIPAVVTETTKGDSKPAAKPAMETVPAATVTGTAAAKSVAAKATAMQTSPGTVTNASSAPSASAAPRTGSVVDPALSTPPPALGEAVSGVSSSFASASAASAAAVAPIIADMGHHELPPSGSGSGKVPRRKPGARECMQISRRFGVRVIPQKYMDILLDYCQRGKVEHLIRMRERLDEHSRFLESQLAGLEALVKEKGETDVVVPAIPQAPDKRAE